jgi:imidazolonepropionase-like amidohydrolase
MLRPFAAVSLALLACGHRTPGSCADAARNADCPTRVEAGRVDAGSTATPSSERFTLVGGTVVGVGPAEVAIDGKWIAEGEVSGTSIDVSGKYLVPAFIDSHVHISYLQVGAELPNHGVAAVVDMAAPITAFGAAIASLVVLRSGPMITAPGGYPTTTWGSGGYGLEVATSAEAQKAVDDLYGAGAALIKFPLTQPPSLDLETASAVAERAHALGLKVAVHALDATAAATAASAGADVLAHTPTQALSAETIEAFEGRTVVSTLAAFGASDVAVDNLRRLREGNVTVLYGTDLGNTRSAGIQPDEIALLASAGLSPQGIIDAGTSVPADYWGLSELGAIAPGKRASFVILPSDPLLDPGVLTAPEAVYIDGVRVAP